MADLTIAVAEDVARGALVAWTIYLDQRERENEAALTACEHGSDPEEAERRKEAFGHNREREAIQHQRAQLALYRDAYYAAIGVTAASGCRYCPSPRTSVENGICRDCYEDGMATQP